ncbi:MAG: hypothetical protein IID44_03745 [Planctomycetes bacterium]|nr:hypothetical protein [Planctomycetota bacterium]
MSESTKPQNKPELSIGPFAGGIGVAVWRNDVQTDDGPRTIRSITIAPRRYRDKTTGEWKDSDSYRPIDLAALILALQKAQEHIYTNPVPGQEQEQEHDDGQTKF